MVSLKKETPKLKKRKTCTTGVPSMGDYVGFIGDDTGFLGMMEKKMEATIWG